MRYTRFTRADFPAYCGWYADEELNRQLGPMDTAWLEHVLADATGVQLSFFLGDTLVAVLGVAFPPTPDLPYVITDLAVQPERRRQGIGRTALALVLAAAEFAEATVWEVYVSPDNPCAQQFFARQGWAQSAVATHEDAMLTYQYRVRAPGAA